jgi:hypothetical protein
LNKNTVPKALRALPGVIQNGGSNPRFYEFDDGVPRLVKWHPSNQGPKVCFNELVASRIGQLFDVPLLRGTVVYISGDVIPPDHTAFATEGFHFGVSRMDGGNFVPTVHYSIISNASSLPVAAVHLAWLQVSDQETHNQYKQEINEKMADGSMSLRHYFRLADMGFLFGIGNNGSWTATTLGKNDAYKLPPHLVAQVTADQMLPVINEVLAIPEAEIRECFDDIPSAWGVPEDDVKASLQWVIDARGNLKTIISKGNPSLVF